MAERLGAVLAEQLGSDVEVDELARLAGGSSRESWRFTARTPGGSARHFVLRRDPPGAPSSGLRLEAALLEAAAAAGVPVPTLVAAGADDSSLGGSFVVVDFVEGETIPRRILRDESLTEARARMAGQCGEILARIHAIPPAAVPGLRGADQLGQLRSMLDDLGQPHPAFEIAIDWLGRHRPPDGPEVVVHGDFRNGNLIVGQEGVRAVLDWELAHLGDPLEDLGWLCMKAWRFGSPLPVGGFGELEDLVTAYEVASARPVDRRALFWWQVLGTLRWGVICIVQAMSHLSGAVPSVELAAVGRRVAEVEWDLLEMLPTDDASPGAMAPTSPSLPPEPDLGSLPPHDRPTAVELLEAVRHFLESDVLPELEGRRRFHGLVAVNVLAMVKRELELGPALAAAHAERLARLGVADEDELARAIRTGAFAGRMGEVRQAVGETVAGKLRVANPAHLDPPDVKAPRATGNSS